VIDTLRREQACDAMLQLVRRYLVCTLTPEEVQKLVDSPTGFLDQPPASSRV
jgi:hypothetical protein